MNIATPDEQPQQLICQYLRIWMGFSRGSPAAEIEEMLPVRNKCGVNKRGVRVKRKDGSRLLRRPSKFYELHISFLAEKRLPCGNRPLLLINQLS